MDRAFIVRMNVEPSADLPTVAQEIFNDLADSGYDILEVHPWDSPTPPSSLTPELDFLTNLL